LFRGSAADHDVHLIRLSAERNLRGRASPREALEARALDRGQSCEGSATGPKPPAAGGRGLPPDDDDYRAAGRDAVRGDLALRRLRANAGRSDDKKRARIHDGTVAGRLDALPARRDYEPDSVGRDDPVGAGQRDESGQYQAHSRSTTFDMTVFLVVGAGSMN
jgi:hypothetical protein